MSINIQEYKPTKKLKPYIELFWEGEFNTSLAHRLSQQVVPNGFVELVIHLTDWHCDLFKEGQWSPSPDYTIIGLYTQPYEVQFRNYVSVFGIRFKPEGIYNLFGIPAAEFSESYEDMELVLGKGFKEYCFRLRESKEISDKLKLSNIFLMRYLEENRSTLTYLNRAADMIRHPHRFNKIEELPDKAYISLRQLEREFKRKIGITPKRYMRLARFNEVHRRLANNEKVEFSKLAFDCGYSDQAHFIRDFQKFMGVTPTFFVEGRHQYIVNA